ncbi:MAG TPA: MFS transporter [Arenibaculum sp.]|nr:MFS transporter [Arenibaculum sp.]
MKRVIFGSGGLLNSRNNRLFYLATFLTTLSEGTFGLATIIYVAQEQGTTLALGFLMILTMLPSLLLGPFAGVVIDRMNRATLAMLGAAGRLVSVLGLMALSLVDGAGIVAFYVFVALYYMFWYLASPNADSLLREILEPEQYVAGSSLAQGVYQFGLIISTVAAGAVIATVGVSSAFILVAVVVVGVGVCFHLLSRGTRRTASQGEKAAPVRSSFFGDLKEGFAQFGRNRATLVYALAGGLVLPAYQALNVLVAPLVFDLLEGNEFELGLVDSAAAVGSIIAAAVCVTFEKRLRMVGLPLVLSLLFGAASVALLPNSGTVPVAFVAYVLVGIFIGNVRVLSRAKLYEVVDSAVIGRVMSTISAAALAAAVLFSLAAGMLGGLGLHVAYYALTGVLLLAGLVVAAHVLTNRTADRKAEAAKAG